MAKLALTDLGPAEFTPTGKPKMVSADHPLAGYLRNQTVFYMGLDACQVKAQCLNPKSAGMWLVSKNGGPVEKVDEKKILLAIETYAKCAEIVSVRAQAGRMPRRPQQAW